MKIVVLLLAFAFSGVSFAEARSNRIIAGAETTFDQFPYSASLQEIALANTETRGHKCGGAIFTLRHVLTSATCTFSGPNVPIVLAEYRVFAGATLLSEDSNVNFIRSLAEITVNPDFNPTTAVANLAVITLSTPFLESTVTPVTLPSASLAPADFAPCQIAGWGSHTPEGTVSNSLRSANKMIANQIICDATFTTLDQLTVTSSMICALSLTASGCTGDEGVALTCDGSLVGIMFRNSLCEPALPDLYTRIPTYLTWIRTFSGSSTFKPELTFIGVLAIAVIKFVSNV